VLNAELPEQRGGVVRHLRVVERAIDVGGRPVAGNGARVRKKRSGCDGNALAYAGSVR
jgi:hypothetical protein